MIGQRVERKTITTNLTINSWSHFSNVVSASSLSVEKICCFSLFYVNVKFSFGLLIILGSGQTGMDIFTIFGIFLIQTITQLTICRFINNKNNHLLQPERKAFSNFPPIRWVWNRKGVPAKTCWICFGGKTNSFHHYDRPLKAEIDSESSRNHLCHLCCHVEVDWLVWGEQNDKRLVMLNPTHWRSLQSPGGRRSNWQKQRLLWGDRSSRTACRSRITDRQDDTVTEEKAEQKKRQPSSTHHVFAVVSGRLGVQEWRAFWPQY